MKPSSLRKSSQFITVFCVALLANAAHASTEYTIAATNVTMPSSGTASTKYTENGIPEPGNLSVNCVYSGPRTTANLPVCDGGPLALIPVTPGQTVTGSVEFYPYGSAVPAERRAWNHLPAGSTALAGAFGLGFALRRKSRQWITLSLLGPMSLAAAATLVACSGGTNGSTPGTYQYTISADTVGSNNNLAAEATTVISVTVP